MEIVNISCVCTRMTGINIAFQALRNEIVKLMTQIRRMVPR